MRQQQPALPQGSSAPAPAPETGALTSEGGQEDKVNHVLLYACRNCPYKKETVNPCVFKHDLLVVAR